jgi:hypothetical protein
MPDSITFRTNDATRWGPGLGADLSATQIDINFWVLYTAVTALQDHQDASAGIDHLVVNENSLYVYLTNHLVLGPYTLPTSQWNFRNEWVPLTNYSLFDVFTEAGAVYLVIFAHRSNSLFSAFSSDGLGHNYYATLLAAPPKELPQSALHNQVLTWLDSPGDVAWKTQTRNIGFYMETEPDPLDVIFRWPFTETTTFPAGLTSSQATHFTPPTVSQDYQIYQAGSNVGTIHFHPSPAAATFTFPTDVTFTPGEVMTIVAPSVPDPHMTGIAVALVGNLT